MISTYDKERFLENGSRQSRIVVEWQETTSNLCSGTATLSAWEKGSLITGNPDFEHKFKVTVDRTDGCTVMGFSRIAPDYVPRMTKEEHSMLMEVIRAYAEATFGSREVFFWSSTDAQ